MLTLKAVKFDAKAHAAAAYGQQRLRLAQEQHRLAALYTEVLCAFEQLIREGRGVDLAPMQLSPNALEVVSKRYLLKDAHTGSVIETPNEMCARVAGKLASVSAQHLSDKDTAERSIAEIASHMYERYVRYYEALRSISVVPAGRTLANESHSVPNCVVLHIQDSLDGIFATLRDAAMLQQAGCGVGFPLHLMRPAGAVTKTSGGTSSGPISFLRVYNAAFGTIKQQNRHGANMGIMKVTHPDILEFIHCKEREGDINNFNISVGLTEEFMRQVVSDCKDPWKPTFEGQEYNALRRIHRDRNGVVTKIEEVTMTASELFREIVQASWANG